MNSLGAIPGFELPPLLSQKSKTASVRFKGHGADADSDADADNNMVNEILGEGQGEAPTQSDLITLSDMIKQWRDLKVQMKSLEESVSEKKKHFKVLDAVILRQMKRFNIGALDLQSSGGRIRYDKKRVQAGLNSKSLEQMLKDYLKSDEEAKKILDFIKEHREIKTKESLKYEVE
jgi:hypothetical protein